MGFNLFHNILFYIFDKTEKIMKKLLFLLAIFYTFQATGQNITFEGTGLSTVKVENLTKGENIIVNPGEILTLSVTTDISQVENEKSSEMKIYPNPMGDKSILEIFPTAEGDAIITLCDLTGKIVTQIKTYLEVSPQKFNLSGIKKGFYLINVRGNTYQLSGKLMCMGKSTGIISIENVSKDIQAIDDKISQPNHKGVQDAPSLLYSIGDILKFTGTSGTNATIITARAITQDTTITFTFVDCTDGDGNNYPIVNIGGLTWMAENLKATKYKDGISIPFVSDNTAWNNLSTPGYCWLSNDEATNKNTFGALYNWYTINTGKLCPDGWHIPADIEWTMLTDYLLGGDSIAGSKLKETGTVHWTNPNLATNLTGFTALPGGARISDGTFLSTSGYFWSQSEYSYYNAFRRNISASTSGVYRTSYSKKGGYSVRCIYGANTSLIPTDTALDNAIIYCYSILSDYIEFAYLFDAIYSDNIGAPNSSWNSIDQHTQFASDNKVLRLWDDAYNIIYKANHVIKSAEALITEPLERNKIIAQAKAIRAYLFYNLLTWFSGIPLEEGFSSGMIPRNSIQEVLDTIKIDATNATQYLPLSWPVSDKFKFPQSFANGLLARIALYNKNYSEALAPTQQIINSSIYTLSADTNNISSTNVEIYWGFAKSVNAEFNSFFNKGSYVPVIRYTESYLVSAEALFNSGNTSGALDYINVLNTRRDNPQVVSLSNDDIFQHWNRELMKEGSMFITLKRFNKALSIVQGMSHRLVLPIPINALDLNPNLFQNPGY
jgi:uncharacterized protein (TIGR02145 family)